MNICGKYKHEFFIEYEILSPEIKYDDNKPTATFTCKSNKKQLRACKKGLALTVKYLKKMKRLGFETVV